MTKKAIAVIGEGITEKYYIESLKGISPFTIMPRELGKKAYKNALSSYRSHVRENRGYSFSEIHLLIKALEIDVED